MVAQIQIKGLAELRAELRRINPKLTREIQKANKTVSERVVSRAQPAVQRLPSPGGSVATSGLRARASQTKATIVLLGSNPTIRANVFGTLSHTVFGKTVAGRGPWLPWVGRSWSPEELHGLGPVMKQEADGPALEEYADAWIRALKRGAFPH